MPYVHQWRGKKPYFHSRKLGHPTRFFMSPSFWGSLPVHGTMIYWFLVFWRAIWINFNCCLFCCKVNRISAAFSSSPPPSSSKRKKSKLRGTREKRKRIHTCGQRPHRYIAMDSRWGRQTRGWQPFPGIFEGKLLLARSLGKKNGWMRFSPLCALTYQAIYCF